jgi:succinate-acetate transporter protein
VNLWNVEIEEANQTGILATGGDIGILSQACAWDFSLPPLLYRERSTSTVQYHPLAFSSVASLLP